MKKTILSCGVAALVFGASLTAQANPVIKALTHLSQNSALYTLHVTTPYDQEIKLDEVRVYMGMSNVNPCSDLVLVADEYSGEQQSFVEKTGTYAIQGEELYDLPVVISCLRFESVYHGKTFSTGNIQLTYNASTQTYTGAIPSSGTINYSN